MSMTAWSLVAAAMAMTMLSGVGFVSFGRKLAMKPRPWEPTSKSEFRRRIGFIGPWFDAKARLTAPRASKSEQLALQEQREQFVARIAATTERADPDRRIKLWPHQGAMEFRCRWTGRDWEPMPPMFGRESIWAEGVEVDGQVEENRTRASMRTDDDPSGEDAVLIKAGG